MPDLHRLQLHDDDRTMFRLAVPAFVALVSEPMFLLADTAVIGFLGTAPLAALSVAATVLQTVVGLCVFLAYATTATVARRLGAGDLRGALGDGVSGLWLAAALGVVLAGVTVAGAAPVVTAFGVTADVGAQATDYLQVSAAGVPSMLLVLAATGILRGLRDVRTPLVVVVAANLANIGLDVALVYGAGLGLVGSALGTVVAQSAAALALIVVVVRRARRNGAALRPPGRAVLSSAGSGLPLFVRTLTLRAVLVSATAAAATLPAASLAAQQITVTVVSVLAYGLDAVAIAAQAIIGRHLGAGDIASARRSTRRMVGWGVAGGVGAGAGLLAVTPWLPRLFTSDADVHSAAVAALVAVAFVQPVSGVVFVLDGVLIGAGDGRYLAVAGLLTVLVYGPAALLVLTSGGGLAALWVAYGAWMLARAGTLLPRARGSQWLRTGAAPPGRTVTAR
ncbi:MAG: MATE family efflux transporter [Actinomycetota bacterium]|nr:MATE family efflux transporter [Actinomycetota bacterium]